MSRWRLVAAALLLAVVLLVMVLLVLFQRGEGAFIVGLTLIVGLCIAFFGERLLRLLPPRK